MTTSPRIPLRNFFKNPEQTAFALSPDGATVSALKPYERRLNIFVTSRDTALGGGADWLRLTGETSRDIRLYFWKGNNHILYLRDFGGDENHHLFAADRSDGSERDLTPFSGVRVEIVDDLEDNDSELIVSMNKRNPEVFDVFRLNIITGELTLIAENPGSVIRWCTDHDGKLRLAVSSDGVNQTLLFRETEAEDFAPIITLSFRDTLAPHFFTFDNRNFYASSNLGRDKAAIVEYDPRQKKEVSVLFEHPEVDVDELRYSHRRKKLTEIGYTTWKFERKVLDPETAKIYDDLHAKLPGKEFVLTRHDREEKHFIVRAYNDRTVGADYCYEQTTGTLTKLAELKPELKEEDLCPMKPIVYQSRDGLTIHGYLTLPKGAAEKNLPIVVHPHGGPWVRDDWGYNAEVQFFANRGYGVLQMNYRGSTGYGRKFWEASFKEWGRAMQDDISDGVLWLIKEGVADPKRIAIYGGSYGGYATLAGMAFTPELYAAGIDYVGVSNLFTFMSSIPPYWKPYLETMYEMVGHPERDKEYFQSSSPVFHTENIQAPLMVLQGAKDPRVNINEANQIVNALQARGIDVPYIVKENEGHGFSNEENRFEAYEAMEEFLKQHLG